MARQLCLLLPLAIGKQLSACALRPHTNTISSVPPDQGRGKAIGALQVTPGLALGTLVRGEVPVNPTP